MANDPLRIHGERLKEAIQAETTRFEKFYLWLEKSMPRIFFSEVNKEWIPLIVHSLMGLKEQDYFAEIHLRGAAISLCIDKPEADVKILHSYPLYGIKNYTTYISREPLPFDRKGFLRIATLQFTDAAEKPAEPLPAETNQELIGLLAARHPEWSSEKIIQLIAQMDPLFLRKLPISRQASALEMFERAQTRDHCQYEVQYDEDWEEKGTASMHVVLAWKNVPKHNFLYRLARVIYQHGLIMRRVNAAYINPYKTTSIFMLAFDLHGANGEAAWDAADIADFLQEVVLVKYFGSMDLIDKTFVQPGLIRGNLGNLLRTILNFIHQVLVHADPNLYNIENIEEGLCRHPELTIKLCEAFEYKFNPRKNNFIRFLAIRDEFYRLISQLDTGHEYHDTRRKHILEQGMNFVAYTLKTNFYKTNKTAFSFRLEPAYLDHAPFERKKFFPELPFGIFFIKGMHFIAFHIRFRDLSRGGLRTVYPKRKERMLAELNTVFTECYNLAYTQHKKNKDIPEGGAKGIIFLKPYAHLTSESEILERELQEAGFNEEKIQEKIATFTAEQELEYLFQTQRSFIKNFLTLINSLPDGTLKSKQIVDYWKKPEYIYLGPDENLYDVMIEWIANESKKVQYKPGGAFISGKPKVGINHKEHGVTSLGVHVYMQEILRYLHIDPTKEKFTIKMTGGPDGDVAGNQILNLYRDYPNTAKLIALTDVSGTIYDPIGLDLRIMADLFYKGEPIRFYPPEKLSKGGFLLDRENRREPIPYVQQTLCWKNHDGEVIADWITGNEANACYRNNVHQTRADIFIPCGGRPRTLRDTNYRDFFDKAGEPTAKAIIEGANLYFSPWARHYLEAAGVLIIKDSSANKGGVICSSFEIICGLTLTDEEFIAHKTALIAEILERLKACSLNEARLLLSEHQKTKKHLTEISDEISKRINHFTDQLLSHLETIQLPDNPKDPLIQCFLHYCPTTLRVKFLDSLLSEIPENHKKAIIASHISSRLVYLRGIEWSPTLIDVLPLILHDEKLIY
jgi:glutamate dehydrogenase